MEEGSSLQKRLVLEPIGWVRNSIATSQEVLWEEIESQVVIEERFSQALETRERIGHPPLLVHTLAQLGSLRQDQDQLHEAVLYFGRALRVAEEYDMRIRGRIFMALAHVMNTMGEEEFMVAWRQPFEGQEPLLPLLRELLEILEGGTA